MSDNMADPNPNLPAPPPSTQVTSTWRPMQNAPEVVQLGAQLAATGLSTIAAQGLMDRLQRASMATAMLTTQEVLEEVRKVVAAALEELAMAVRQQHAYATTLSAAFLQGINADRRNQLQLIDRNQVLTAIAAISSRVARP